MLNIHKVCCSWAILDSSMIAVFLRSESFRIFGA